MVALRTETIYFFFVKQPILMRRSTVLSTPLLVRVPWLGGIFKHGAKTLSVTTLSIIVFGLMTSAKWQARPTSQNIMTSSLMTLGIMPLSMTIRSMMTLIIMKHGIMSVSLTIMHQCIMAQSLLTSFQPMP